MLIGSPKASLTMHGSAVLVFERSGRESETARHRAMTDRPPTPRLLLRPVTIPPARRRTFPRERANRRLQCGDGSRINQPTSSARNAAPLAKIRWMSRSVWGRVISGRESFLCIGTDNCWLNEADPISTVASRAPDDREGCGMHAGGRQEGGN